ncbi:MAG: ABC transporter permease subunit [Elioraea sp.]|nr:ABC transporter permease subunit [Elioraea sp.]MDW8442877.1 ABC transporter permease subunit [Acetobacteraceae bacterium]
MRRPGAARRAGAVVVLLAAVGYLVLLGPVVVVAAVSLSAGQFLSFPPPGLSLRWFRALFANREIMSALATSALLATVVAVVALVVALPAAYAVARLSFPGRRALADLLIAPLALPTLVLGLALLLALQPLKLVATWPGLVLAHLTLAVPFAVRILLTAISAVPADLEAAARTLGAGPVRTVLRVTLPLSAPGILAAGALCFLVSFDETVISLFLVGPRLTTLPVELFRYTENRTDPLVAAMSMLLIGVALVVVLIVERLAGLSRALSRE